MIRIVATRLLLAIPLLFAVSFLIFLLINLIPGDPAAELLGPQATPDQIAELRSQLGLDQPVLVQYGNWLAGAIRGDLGTSIYTGEPVAQALNTRLPVTVSLVALTILFSSIVGVVFGVLSATGSGRTARIADVVSLVGYAIPNFWLGLLLIAGLAVSIPLFPATGYVEFATSPALWLWSLVLPVLTLGGPVVANIAKQTREAMLDAMSRDYIKVLRANGASETSIVYKHALKNAAAPIITVIGLICVGLTAGAVVVEQVFVLPGLGSLAVSATTRHDLPVITGVVVYFTLIVIVVNLVVDLAYGWLNPKERKA
jgi:peptide/nickel transport system permease protein